MFVFGKRNMKRETGCGSLRIPYFCRKRIDMDTNTPDGGLFAEFPPVSKAAWLEQVAKSLKDKTMESLEWRLPDGTVLSPFVHADDFAQPPLPLTNDPLHWEICEAVDAGDSAANADALSALQGGAEGLRFYFSETPSAETLGALLEGIYLDFIVLHFSGPGVAANPGTLLAALERLAGTKKLDTAKLRGSLGYDPAAVVGIVDWRYAADLLPYVSGTFPGFKMLTLQEEHSTPHKAGAKGAGEATDALPWAGLADLLRRGNTYLERLNERGAALADIAAAMQFSLGIGQHYFVEIARIRAFRLLWPQVLRAWGLAPTYPVVDAQFRPEVYSDDLYTNMIRATTMAMSAVQGGVDRLTVLPYDAGREDKAEYPQAFGRRIARNVQQLLKLESGFDQVPDPAAGSYYIENLTRLFAEKAWAQFQQTA